MFFHADDVRPGLASIPSERYFEKGNIMGPNSGGLDKKNTTSQSPGNSSPSLAGERPRFIDAYGMIEPTLLPILYTKPTSRPRSQVFTGGDSTPNLQQQRAPSPLKDEVLSRKSSLSKASPRQHRRLVSNNTLLHEQEIKLPEIYPLGSGSANVSRRSSFSSPGQARISHHKSSSVSAVGTFPARRSSIALSDSPLVNSPGIPPSVEPGKLQGFQVSPISASENPLLQGPGKPVKAQSKLDHMNELAANARRERKVLDLEISNSSLLAINRTLEREMRKQNAELRRFRRLSRTGRLSAAPFSRSASKTLSVWSESEDHINNSDAPSGRSSPLTLEDDENDEENSTVSSSADSSDPLSPLDTARVRAKDFKRLHLDLARHRALLVDSQKLDQSLKRCLSRTEDLLADGRKALEYRVQIDKVDTHGGRVLLPDELEENEVGEQRQGLLSPGISERPEMMWKMGDSFEEQDQHEVTADELVVNEADTVVTDGKIELPDSLKEESQDFEAITQNEWDRIKSDVQTPEEFIGSGGGVQGLKEYLSSLGPSWGV